LAPTVRIDVLLMTYAVWLVVAWLAGRDVGEPAIAISTALTGAFVLAPFSWLNLHQA
jgi:hypothetical protein